LLGMLLGTELRQCMYEREALSCIGGSANVSMRYVEKCHLLFLEVCVMDRNTLICN